VQSAGVVASLGSWWMSTVMVRGTAQTDDKIAHGGQCTPSPTTDPRTALVPNVNPREHHLHHIYSPFMFIISGGSVVFA
jgi:hypothetical protein